MKKIRALWLLLTHKNYFLVTAGKNDLFAKVAIDEDNRQDMEDYIRDLMQGRHNYEWLN